MKPRPNPALADPEDQKSYALHFAALGAILLFGCFLAFIMDVWFWRPYKRYQHDFLDAARAEYSGQLKAADEAAQKVRTFEDFSKSPAFKDLPASKQAELSARAERYQEALKRVADARKALDSAEVQARLKAWKDEMNQAWKRLNEVRAELRIKRGDYQAAIYEMEVTHGESGTPIVQKLEPDVRRLTDEMVGLDLKIKAIKKKIFEQNKPVIEAEAHLASFQEDVTAKKRLIEGLDDFDVEVKQEFNENLGMVDRCVSCHAGVQMPDLENLERVEFQTHPVSTDPLTGETLDLLSVHPPRVFGCTPCHRGQGFATGDAKKAHGEVHFWRTPMLRGPYKEGACFKCHREQKYLRFAPTLMEGRRLFESYGCWGCHKVDEIGDERFVAAAAAEEVSRLEQAVEEARLKWEDTYEEEDLQAANKLSHELSKARYRADNAHGEVRQIGPDLRDVRTKLYPGWLPVWLRDPKAWRPTTKMPNFFPDREPGFYLFETKEEIDRTNEEMVKALSAYLWQTGKADPEGPLGEVEPPPSEDEITRGRELFEAVGCQACHRVGNPSEEVARRAAEELFGAEVESRKNYSLILDLLQNPTREIPADQMDDEETFRIVDYRFATGFGPDLGRVGEKARRSWMKEWIKDPRKLQPDSKMPNLRLSDEQASDIAAYLSTLRETETPPMPEWINDETLAAKGEKLIKHYGCFGCHNINGMEGLGRIGTELSAHGSKFLEEFDFGHRELEMEADGRYTRIDWLTDKLKDPRTYDQGRYRDFKDRLKMPKFNFTERQIQAVVTFLSGLTEEHQKLQLRYIYRPRGPEAWIAEGEGLIDKYNCRACHSIHTHGGYIRAHFARTPEDIAQAPPSLEGEGDKVQPRWLFRFLKAPIPLRLWLNVKMPTFNMSDLEATNIARYFAGTENQVFPYEYRFEEPLTDHEKKVGEELFNAMQCVSCHVVKAEGGETAAGVSATSFAPDLSLAGERLKPSWIDRWLLDPGALQKDTKMPTFFPEGETQFPMYLDGDTQRQIRAIRAHTMSLGHKK